MEDPSKRAISVQEGTRGCAKGNRKYRKERIHGFPPSRLTLHPRAEMRLVLRENAGRYRTLNESRFLEMVRRLKAQGVALQVVRK